MVSKTEGVKKTPDLSELQPLDVPEKPKRKRPQKTETAKRAVPEESLSESSESTGSTPPSQKSSSPQKEPKKKSPLKAKKAAPEKASSSPVSVDAAERETSPASPEEKSTKPSRKSAVSSRPPSLVGEEGKSSPTEPAEEEGATKKRRPAKKEGPSGEAPVQKSRSRSAKQKDDGAAQGQLPLMDQKGPDGSMAPVVQGGAEPAQPVAEVSKTPGEERSKDSRAAAELHAEVEIPSPEAPKEAVHKNLGAAPETGTDPFAEMPDLSALPENLEEETISEGPEALEGASESLLVQEVPGALSAMSDLPDSPPANWKAEGKPIPRRPRYPYVALAGMTMAELRQIAGEYGIPVYSVRRKDELIYQILAAQAARIDQSFGGGTLEIMEEGYGFLRPEGLLPGDHDIYMSASQIRRFRLRNGDVVWGMIRKGRESGQNSALSWVEMINFSDPEKLYGRPQFQNLVPVFPNRQLKLETDRGHLAARLIDLFAPLGRGQRALIVSPPKAGKTSLLKEIASSITQNYSDVILMVLLIDERPEEVTDIKRSVVGEVIASTFDRPSYEHIRVANLALEKAKRLVEMKKDVVLLLDSITRLTRASNLCEPPSGRTLSGGMDPAGLYFPKRLFGAARNIESGGSLTIVATALTETGSRMDDVIYEEFKGTGNMEIHLSRRLAEQRLFPALDIPKSGTRRDDLLLSQEDLEKIWALQRRSVSAEEAEALSLILDRLRRSSSNAEFLSTIKNV